MVKIKVAVGGDIGIGVIVAIRFMGFAAPCVAVPTGA
jgi:hypothetical protein